MNTAGTSVEESLLRQAPAGLAWAERQGLILPDYEFNPASRSFVFRANAYGLQWVPGRAFQEATRCFGHCFGGTISREGRDYAFVVLGAAPLSPNIKAPFVCLRAPRRDARSAPRLGLMLEKLVLAVSLHRIEWSPPFSPPVAEWLWRNRQRCIPVPQPNIAWARRWEKVRTES